MPLPNDDTTLVTLPQNTGQQAVEVPGGLLNVPDGLGERQSQKTDVLKPKLLAKRLHFLLQSVRRFLMRTLENIEFLDGLI